MKRPLSESERTLLASALRSYRELLLQDASRMGDVFLGDARLRLTANLKERAKMADDLAIEVEIAERIVVEMDR